MESPEDIPKSGEMCSVAGWGTTSERNHFSSVMMEVKVPIVAFNKCLDLFEEWDNGRYKGRIYGGNICAGQPNRDSCKVNYLISLLLNF